MTVADHRDARYVEHWLLDFRVLRLSYAAHHLFVISLAWSVVNRSNGVIDETDLRLMPGVDPGRVAELTESGLWERADDHWRIVDFAATQTTSDDLDRIQRLRRFERERKAKRRQSPITPALRHAVLERDGYACRYCGSQAEPFHMDHVQPVSLGGLSTLENLVTACGSCNSRKGANQWVPLPIQTLEGETHVLHRDQ